MNTKIRQIILGSKSARRIEILKEAQLDILMTSVDIDETPKSHLTLDQRILEIADRKMQTLLKASLDSTSAFPETSFPWILITADTMVCFEDKTFGKPSSLEEAIQTLKFLSNKTHQVKTAVCIFDQLTNKQISFIETTHITFKKLTDQQITDYVLTYKPLDKAGSYGIQESANEFIDSIQGDYLNVVGLPLAKLLKTIFMEFGFLKTIESTTYKTLINQISDPTVSVVAVSKLQSIEKILTLYNQGQKDFAENYVQEAIDKIKQLDGLDIRWHFIGNLQKNKVKYLKNFFWLIHSVDSLSIAKLLNEKCNQLNHKQNILIQVNLANEESKSGFSIVHFNNQLTEFDKFKNLCVMGLMTMPPLQNSAENNRIYFKNLNDLAKQHQFKYLSMGTSHDFKIALEEGSTCVRLGTVLFGERKKVM